MPIAPYRPPVYGPTFGEAFSAQFNTSLEQTSLEIFRQAQTDLEATRIQDERTARTDDQKLGFAQLQETRERRFSDERLENTGFKIERDTLALKGRQGDQLDVRAGERIGVQAEANRINDRYYGGLLTGAERIADLNFAQFQERLFANQARAKHQGDILSQRQGFLRQVYGEDQLGGQSLLDLTLPRAEFSNDLFAKDMDFGNSPFSRVLFTGPRLGERGFYDATNFAFGEGTIEDQHFFPENLTEYQEGVDPLIEGAERRLGLLAQAFIDNPEMVNTPEANALIDEALATTAKELGPFLEFTDEGQVIGAVALPSKFQRALGTSIQSNIRLPQFKKLTSIANKMRAFGLRTGLGQLVIGEEHRNPIGAIDQSSFPGLPPVQGLLTQDQIQSLLNTANGRR